ncbi:MAG: hypothetical protein EAZ97_11980 [Bacteroidetes bacterium]|nr:MAG: hypothetical protein EAZ97_11980 [Bacteroidota bacterium]
MFLFLQKNIKNMLSIPIQIVDSLPKDLDSRLLMPKNVAFKSTVAEFLAFAEICQYKIEFHEGFIISFYENIFGQMFNHEYVVTEFLRIVGNYIETHELDWKILSSNISVFIDIEKPCVYKPDALVFKHKPKIITFVNPTDDSKHQATPNPTNVFEVLSKSTRNFDLTEKLRNYKNIPSMEQIIFAERKKFKVTVHEKINEIWLETVYTNPNDVFFVADCPVLMAKLYKNVDFDQE